MRTKSTLMICVAVVCFGLAGSVSAEKIEVSCKEYAELSMNDLPCDTFKTLKVEREEYDAAVRNSKIRKCKGAVQAKYSGVECQPMRLYDTEETDAHRCYDEMMACEEAHAEPAEASATSEKKKKVELW